MKKISPILEAKREKNKNSFRGVKRQYGESLTSDECIMRMTMEEEEKMKKAKGKAKGKGKGIGKGKRTVRPKTVRIANPIRDSTSESEVDDVTDKDCVPQRSRKDNDESESDEYETNDAH